MNRAELNLRRLQTLTEYHIRLSPRHSMREKFAVHVNKSKLYKVDTRLVLSLFTWSNT